MAGCKDPFLAVCLSLSGDRRNGLMPYLAMREANQQFSGQGCLPKLLDSLDGVYSRSLASARWRLMDGLIGGFYMQQFQAIASLMA